MKGIIKAVNYTRSLFVFEDETGDCGYFEAANTDDFEEDDIIFGNLHNLGDITVVKEEDRAVYAVTVEDFGMTLEHATEMIF